MASNSELQVTWGGTNTQDVSGGGSQTSDVVSLTDGAIQLAALIKADHQGAPDSGDVIEFVFQYTIGDPDGSSSDEYSTENHSFSATVSVFDEDPAIAYIQLPAPIKSLQIIVNNTGTGTVTASATIMEQTA